MHGNHCFFYTGTRGRRTPLDCSRNLEPVYQLHDQGWDGVKMQHHHCLEWYNHTMKSLLTTTPTCGPSPSPWSTRRRVFVNNVAGMKMKRIASQCRKDNRERIQSVVLRIYANLSQSLYLRDEKSLYKFCPRINFVTV